MPKLQKRRHYNRQVVMLRYVIEVTFYYI